MRGSNFALRLQPSLLEELRKAADMEGVALNQFINVAVAEKISALRTAEYFRERASRADRKETLQILERAGKGNRPMAGDELPLGWEIDLGKRKPDSKLLAGKNKVAGQRRKRKTQS
jgi:HicB family